MATSICPSPPFLSQSPSLPLSCHDVSCSMDRSVWRGRDVSEEQRPHGGWALTVTSCVSWDADPSLQSLEMITVEQKQGRLAEPQPEPHPRELQDNTWSCIQLLTCAICYPASGDQKRWWESSDISEETVFPHQLITDMYKTIHIYIYNYGIKYICIGIETYTSFSITDK